MRGVENAHFPEPSSPAAPRAPARGRVRALVGLLLLGAAASVGLAFSHLGTLPLHAAVALIIIVTAAVTASDPASARLGKVEEAILEQHTDPA